MKKTNTLLVALILFDSAISYGQFNIDWATSYQHTSANDFSNEARKIVSDPLSGDIYALQDVTSNLDLQGNTTGNIFHYTVLTKYNSGGSFIQQEVINVGAHTVNGFDLSSGFGLDLDGSGDVYVGYTSHDAITGYDVNIAKYNSGLTLQWTNRFNPTTDDVGVQMKLTQNGNAYAIAKSSSGPSVRHKVLKATGAGISTVALYTFSPLPDYLNSIALDASENIYVTGYR